MNGARADALVNFAAHPLAWPAARVLRRIGPMVRLPGLGYAISDAALVHDVLLRDEEFTKNGPGSFAAQMTAALGPAALANMDGPPHLALRERLTSIFSPAGARRLLAGCDAPLLLLRSDLRDGRVVDLVRFMRLLSGRVTFDMLGVPLPLGGEADACLRLVALGERIAASLTLRPPSDTTMRAVRADCDQLADYCRIGYDAPDAPEQSLMARLRQQGLTFEEARGIISLVFLAGTITTAASLPRIVALLVDTGQWPRRPSPNDDPPFDAGSWAPRAIAEGLRYTAPVPATMRIAAHDTVLRGCPIARGTRLVLLTCNAARDAALFPDPDRFDVSRVHDPRARNLWFGAGVHFCLGFAVAQRQLQLALETLLAEPGALQIVRRRRGGRSLVASYALLDVRLAPMTA